MHLGHFGLAMTSYFGSSMYRTWVIEEEEDEDDFHLIVDDDDAELVEWVEVENARASHRIRCSDAPPKQIRKRDLASGDARIRADYFGSNTVSVMVCFENNQLFHEFSLCITSKYIDRPYLCVHVLNASPCV
jgi:hypothetical protein